ncbi:MAG: hypothetical protein LUE61_06750, partial [Clostridiales bacterium]|nr:hypothetical protein [Clostridiales bacterium]
FWANCLLTKVITYQATDDVTFYAPKLPPMAAGGDCCPLRPAEGGRNVASILLPFGRGNLTVWVRSFHQPKIDCTLS